MYFMHVTRVTDKQTGRRTDYYDTQDRASIVVSRSKKTCAQ